MKYAAALAVVLVIGCGGQDQAEESVAAEGDAAAATATETGDLSDVAGSVEAAEELVQDCLELVAGEQFAEAVPICVVAVAQNPGNEEALAALTQAKAETEGAAEAMASDAMDEAKDTATDVAGEAGSLMGKTD